MSGPLRVVIAPDSFKGVLSATRVAEELASGWRSLRPQDELILIPQADGGEGTLAAIARSIPGARTHPIARVTGPDGNPVAATWLELPDSTALIELAQTSGLPLMRTLDPLHATTRGLGEAIHVALDAGVQRLIIGLGGSASTDGGMGALAALGLKLVDASGQVLPDGGQSLARLEHVDRSNLRPPPAGGVRLLSDVSIPLLGGNGAVPIFGPQKGADLSDQAILTRGLTRLVQVLGGNPDEAGAGAAGGTGYGFMTAWQARFDLGSAAIAHLTGLSEAAATADLILTGEGRYDIQSTMGKVVGTVLGIAERDNTRAGVIAGQLDGAPATESGAPVWALSLTEIAGSSEAAMREAPALLREAGARAALELGISP